MRGLRRGECLGSGAVVSSAPFALSTGVRKVCDRRSGRKKFLAQKPPKDVTIKHHPKTSLALLIYGRL